MRINNENFESQLQLHNERAMEYLEKEYGIYLISIIRKHLFTLPHLQVECMVETLMCIWEHIDMFDRENEFENWIGSVARYCCLEFLRKYQQEATIAWLIEKEISEEREVMLNSLSEEQQKLFGRFYEGEVIKKGSCEYHKSGCRNMYELLNKIDTDICEYEKEPLTPEEQEAVEKKVHDRIGKKHGIPWRRNINTLFQLREGKQVMI